MLGSFTQRMRKQATRAEHLPGHFDPWLLGAMVALASLGVVMVASSSFAIAESRDVSPFYYLIRHTVYLCAGGVMAFVLSQIEIKTIERYARILPPLAVLCLLLVLIPGLGHVQKGARRWISLFGFTFQPAEVAKVMMIVWLASYLKRYSEQVRATGFAIIKPFLVAMALSLVLLFVQKDFGSTALILAITAGMLVLGGAHLPRLVMPALLLLPGLALMILLEPYRIQRLVSYRNPWADPFGSGYQLSNALMAVGRGEFFGVGLGGSVQKLSYLPEAYTDFIMAVIAEELGFVGVCTVIALYAIVVVRAFNIGYRCMQMRRQFAGNLAFGIGLWIALQSFVSIGVNLGVLPTKGLTLPLVSSGGSSVIVTCIAFALLLRVSYELDRAERQVSVRRGEVPADVTPAPSLASLVPAPARAVGEQVAGVLARMRTRGSDAPKPRVEPALGDRG